MPVIPEDAPPIPPHGPFQTVDWVQEGVDARWFIRDMTQEELAIAFPPPEPPEPDPPTVASTLTALATRRLVAEEAGTMFNAFPLATDRTTQAKITAAYVKATADPAYTIAQWKFAPGIFAPLDAATIIAAANAMEAHVQACFTNEAALSTLILAAETPEALAAIDLEQGWP